MFDEIPMQSHDIFMDKVVTESNVYLIRLAARVETKQDDKPNGSSRRHLR